MDEQTTLYVVIFENKKGRLTPCKCMHKTPDEAHECAKKLKAVSIMEWVKDRNPQFAEFWRREDQRPS